MAKVVLQPTGKMPDRQRQKYMTRHMSADGEGFEVSTRDAKLLQRLGWATEPAPVLQPQTPRRRGRPQKQRSEAVAADPGTPDQPSEDQADDELEGRSNAELRSMAEAQGIELPTGYVRNDEIITRLRGLV